ncbi:ABC transporter permease [Sporolactobacillus sp. CQH2019]|uniref:ABC transporter permease n=1 Tax=Sporolactobacillus sp. CQH2019 TaxID=3023512 RepID=UPI003083C17B
MYDGRFELLNQGSIVTEQVTYKERRETVLYRLIHDRRAVTAGSVLIVLTIVCLFAFLSPYDPNQLSIADKLRAPSWAHWFGTDDHGRDYLTRILYGGRVSLAVGLLSMLIAVSLGTLIGTVSGYLGGGVDSLFMRTLDVFMTLPSFFILMILNAYLKPSVANMIIIIGLLSWMDVARIVRSQTMSIKEQEFMLYAQSIGVRMWRAIFKHLIPGVMPSIVVAASLNVANAILTESALSFLGLGVQPPASSWGSMLNNAQDYIGTAGYLAIFPGVLILIVILSFNIIGDALRDAIEPVK